ncbi:MAG TPA: Gfo/Idh/MocA family oxidoreductase, partial [Syntrophales bacterium]|nr:Gfo/Idh/MocA family oxidoreductase [Syntrophales bacterium]
MNKESMPKVAVIGAGAWGRNLVRNYHQLGALHMVCDADEAVLSQLEKQYPQTRPCLAYADVLSDPAVQGVVISTPAETHFSLAREA